jgi:hypothetical protein
MKKGLLFVFVILFIHSTITGQILQVDTCPNYPVLEASKIKYAKLVKKQIWKHNPANKLLFHPGIDKRYNNFFEYLMKNLISKAPFYSPIYYYNNQLFHHEIGHEFSDISTYKDIEERMQYYSNTMRDSTWSIIKASNTITSYFIHEMQFYDFKNKLILNQIIGFSPVYEYHNYKGELCFKEVAWIDFQEAATFLNT